jgi:hypothetical protein
MPVHSNREAIEARLLQAIDDGLVAGGNVYRSHMQDRLIEGYTSGAFVSGMQGVAGSVAVSEPQGDETGRFVVVGTSQRDATGTVSYPLAWELGHQNLFTGRFERVEKWRPGLDEDAPAMTEKFRAVVARQMETP